MDPVSALSIAAVVVQFVDFGAKTLSKSHELYRSSRGALNENIETEAATKRKHPLSLEHAMQLGTQG